MGRRTDTALVDDILQAIERISRYSAGMSFQEFVDDSKTMDAVVRNLEIIGEAAKKLSPEFRAANNSIPWADITGMRDRLIHDYFGTDSTILWQTIIADVPQLKARRELLPLRR